MSSLQTKARFGMPGSLLEEDRAFAVAPYLPETAIPAR